MLTLLAHAAPISYKFPLPIWLYVLAGGGAVLLSAPAAALAVSDAPMEERAGRDLYGAARGLRLGPILVAIGTILIAFGLVGGLFSTTEQSTEFFENPMTLLTWVDFWVGLGIVSWLVGNVWERVSPLNVAARALDRLLARNGVEPLAYPAGLGQWPAVTLLLIWSWMELIWGPAKEPRTLALLMLGYALATLAGSAVFGAEAWLGNVELFSVFARTLSRFSPLELRPFVPEVWASTAPEERSARLRGYGAGLRTDPPLAAGGGAFVLAALATVVFDGWSQTDRFGSFQQWFYDRWSFLSAHTDVLQTLSMVAVVAVFVAAYLAITRRNARVLAPTLIPIAAVYFTAHYFAYLLIAGEDTPAVLVDPFGHSWNPLGWGEYGLWKGIAPAAVVWLLQVLLIVWGHVAAVFAAHRLALRGHTRARAMLAQAPLVALMVAYTVAGLWVLAQQLKA
ncbi:MAG: hypothetical protein H0X39_20075 [Actinobacteria bacterium]|nr:hypothetical protein [Actinomycetota bacterium]